MDKIQLWVDHLLEACGFEGDSVAYISHAVLVVIAILLAVRFTVTLASLLPMVNVPVALPDVDDV